MEKKTDAIYTQQDAINDAIRKSIQQEIRVNKVNPDDIDDVRITTSLVDSDANPYNDLYDIYYFEVIIKGKAWSTTFSAYKTTKPDGPLDGNYLDICSGFVTIPEGDDWKDWIKNHCFIKTYGDKSQSVLYAYTDEEGWILNFNGRQCQKADAVALR